MEEDLKNPYVPPAIVEYLDKAFNVNFLLNVACQQKDANFGLGYMRGVLDVIEHLGSIVEDQKGE